MKGNPSPSLPRQGNNLFSPLSLSLSAVEDDVPFFHFSLNSFDSILSLFGSVSYFTMRSLLFANSTMRLWFLPFRSSLYSVLIFYLSHFLALLSSYAFFLFASIVLFLPLCTTPISRTNFLEFMFNAELRWQLLVVKPCLLCLSVKVWGGVAMASKQGVKSRRFGLSGLKGANSPSSSTTSSSKQVLETSVDGQSSPASTSARSKQRHFNSETAAATPPLEAQRMKENVTVTVRFRPLK